GPARGPDRPAPQAGIVADRVVLPYWTKRHDNFSLDVDRAGKALGLGRLTPEDATVSETHPLSIALPLHVPDRVAVLVRLTSTATGERIQRTGTLTPADGARSLLEAGVPLHEVRGAAWRLEVCLAPRAEAPRFLPLPLVLRPARTGGAVLTRPAAAGPVRRLVRRVRRVLGAALRGTTSRGTAARETTRKA
ncbi:glycosyltransferase family 2 protein, partial [Streptomyces shenzhenensis]